MKYSKTKSFFYFKLIILFLFFVSCQKKLEYKINLDGYSELMCITGLNESIKNSIDLNDYHYFQKGERNKIWVIALKKGSYDFESLKVVISFRDNELSVIFIKYDYDHYAYKKGDFLSYTGTNIVYSSSFKKLKIFIYQNGFEKKILPSNQDVSVFSLAGPPDNSPPTNWCLIWAPLCDNQSGWNNNTNGDPTSLMMVPPDFNSGNNGYVPPSEIFPDLSTYDAYSDDASNYTIGNYDNTVIPAFDAQIQQWPTVSNVIPTSKFVEYDHSNCLDLSIAQIGKLGYKISEYYALGQTFVTYKESTGVDKNAAKDGVSYLISALQRGIPVIAGVDHTPGPSPGNPDNTTDHFVVIVGMGTDANGKYFRFFDNATNYPSKGASSSNKLYYNETSGIIKGQTSVTYTNGTSLPLYTVTQIRKSK